MLSSSAWLLGAVLGMRHALEPDHLAAVSALAAEQRGRRAGLLLGASWGVGHALSLLAVAGSLALLERRVPEPVTAALELLVAVVITALGVRSLRKAWTLGRSGPAHLHAHGEVAHVHHGPEAHIHLSGSTLATRPLLVGLLHGLAGSGALTALVLARLEGATTRLAYVALFSLGSVAGMGLLTSLAGLSLERLRHPRTEWALLLLAGLLAVGTGSWWGLQSVLAFRG
jgi:hypothetical protein